MTATLGGVPRPRGSLTEAQRQRLDVARAARDAADAEFRAEVLDVLGEGASMREVGKATGLSTNTLQRWKDESRIT